jgi:hypothetical protein
MFERDLSRKARQAGVGPDKDVMSDLRHAIGRHMPIRNFRHVLLVSGDQFRKTVDLSVQHPPDNLEIIGHQSLHSNEAGPPRRHMAGHRIIPHLKA